MSPCGPWLASVRRTACRDLLERRSRTLEQSSYMPRRLQGLHANPPPRVVPHITVHRGSQCYGLALWYARRCATEADNSTARVARRPSVTCARCERCALPGERCALPAFVAFYETMRRNLRVATSFSWAQATMQAVRTTRHHTIDGIAPCVHWQRTCPAMTWAAVRGPL